MQQTAITLWIVEMAWAWMTGLGMRQSSWGLAYLLNQRTQQWDDIRSVTVNDVVIRIDCYEAI